jgi:hypothetical protein
VGCERDTGGRPIALCLHVHSHVHVKRLIVDTVCEWKVRPPCSCTLTLLLPAFSGQLILTSLNSSKSICPSSFVSNSSRARAKFPGNVGLALLMLKHRTAVECREGAGKAGKGQGVNNEGRSGISQRTKHLPILYRMTYA